MLFTFLALSARVCNVRYLHVTIANQWDSIIQKHARAHDIHILYIPRASAAPTAHRSNPATWKTRYYCHRLEQWTTPERQKNVPQPWRYVQLLDNEFLIPLRGKDYLGGEQPRYKIESWNGDSFELDGWQRGPVIVQRAELAAAISKLEITNRAFEIPRVAREVGRWALAEEMHQVLSLKIPADYYEKQSTATYVKYSL